MGLDENIYELRREKLKQIEALGQPTYPSKYDVPHTIGYLRDKYEKATPEELESTRPHVQIAGRIMAVRLMGKAAFAHMQSTARRDRAGTRQLQIYVKRDSVGDQAFDVFKLLDIGDIVGVSGYLFRTRTGELTVHVEQLTLLAKDLLPLPEKWHGLTDVETRYRQRYVDLLMNPDVRKVFIARSKLIRSMRQSFDSREFIEVETPMMHPIAGGAVARPFVTHHNTLDMDLFLRIAPELYLKRLVVGGFDRVFEINRNFRNEGISFRHNPEFTMLEAYQAYTNYEGIMNLTQQVITEAAIAVNGSAKSKWTLTEEGKETVHELDWSSWQRLTMREAIIKFWPQGCGDRPDLLEFSNQDVLIKRFRTAADTAHHVGESSPGDAEGRKDFLRWEIFFNSVASLLEKGESVGKVVAAVFEAVAEEYLMQPTIIYEFPTAVSPLSKQKPDDPEWTERFEIYAGQMEIANGFSELNDPEDQRQRFEAQLKERERGDEEAHQMDEDYIRALSYGMPPAGGVGIGIDRVCMLLTDSHTIRDVILFPQMRPQKELTAEDAEDAEK